MHPYNYAVGLERSSGSLTEAYTLFSGVTLPYSGTLSAVANSFTGTAGLVNAAAGDFHIGAGSDAIDAGLAAGVGRFRRPTAPGWRRQRYWL